MLDILLGLTDISNPRPLSHGVVLQVQAVSRMTNTFEMVAEHRRRKRGYSKKRQQLTWSAVAPLPATTRCRGVGSLYTND